MGIAFGVEWGNRSSPGPHYVFSLDELLPGDHVVVFTPTKEGKPRDEQPRL